MCTFSRCEADQVTQLVTGGMGFEPKACGLSVASGRAQDQAHVF